MQTNVFFPWSIEQKQGPQKLSFSPLKTRKFATKSSNSRWQTRKERPNRSTNNGDMTERAKRPES